jgi:hypothetical protein
MAAQVDKLTLGSFALLPVISAIIVNTWNLDRICLSCLHGITVEVYASSSNRSSQLKYAYACFWPNIRLQSRGISIKECAST